MSNLCAYSDIEWEILYRYKNKESIYVICSKEGDAYYFCKESFLKIILETLQLFDGKHSIEEIIESISIKYPEFKTKDMIMKLARSKFIKGIEVSNVSSELKRSSISIKEFNISSVGKLKRFWVEFFYRLFFLLVIMSIFICLYLFTTNKLRIWNYSLKIAGNSYIEKILVVVACIFFSLIFHELAHILVGLYYRLPPSKFGIALYMNIVPMYYIVTPGTYLIGRYARMKFHIAGVCANFILFAFFFMFGEMFHNDIFYLIAISNFQLILVNLMPFSLTDGYFLMTILLKKINLRLDFIDAITFRNKNSHKSDMTIKVYSVISMLYIVVLSLNVSFWITDILNDYLPSVINVTVLTIIISVVITLIIILIMIGKTRRMSTM